MLKGINKNTHKLSGVYEIRNTLNNKRYIGSSINIYRRWRDHKRMLNLNVHPNKHLQAAWNKYGEKHFVFKILETCEPIKDTILFLEQKYLDLKPEYNNSPTAGSNLGWKPNEEFRARCRERMKGKMNIPKEIVKLGIHKATEVKKKPVLQYTKDGNFIAEYSSQKEAALLVFGNERYHKSISGCCRGNRKEAKGYIWRYKTDNYPNKIKSCLVDRYKNNKKAVYQIDPVTEEIIAEHPSTKEAAIQFSKSTYSSISLCCNGKYKTAFGFKWKYKN